MVAASAWEDLLDNGIQVERQVRGGRGAERTKRGSRDGGYPCEGAIGAQPHRHMAGLQWEHKPCEPHGSSDNGV